MPPENDFVRVHHIRVAAGDAISFCRDRRRQDLDGDRMLEHSLIRCLEIIGEAASKISIETRLTIPEVPWTMMVAMRHHLAHGYFDINLDIVWNTVHEDLPPLVAALEAWLAEHS